MFSFKLHVEIWPFQQTIAVAVILVNRYISLSSMFSFKFLVEIWPFQQTTVVAVILVNQYFSLQFFLSKYLWMVISATYYCCCSDTCKSLFVSLFNVLFQSKCGDMAISATYCCCSYTCKSLYFSLQYFLSKYLLRYGHFIKLLLLQLYL